jgi:DNA-binding transcriptional LysR family regulator
LEQSLGEKLFHKSGRHLILTDTGKLVFRYAEEIFSLGQELMLSALLLSQLNPRLCLFDNFY